MIKPELREKIVNGTGIIKGYAVSKIEHKKITKNQIGAITLFLPNEKKFEILWPGNIKLAYNIREEEFYNLFELYAPDEIIFEKK